MMQHQPIGRSDGEPTGTSTLWLATTPPGPRLGGLAMEIETDILVIGGGVAGLSTALHLAEAGIDCTVLEAKQPGSAATGWSGGLIAPDYIRHTPETIGPVLGRQAAERLTRMIGTSAATVFDLIARHAIDCDAQQDGFYTPAHTEALATNQRRYAMQWHSRGYPVEFVEAEAARRTLGVERYCGALRFAHGGSLNPLAFARGLAGAAAAQGARVFAESPVLSLDRDESQGGGRWIARTAHGAVSARRLVLAANGGNAALHPAMRSTALPLHVIQFSTAPLPATARAHILPDGGAFTDKVPYLFTARYDGAGRMISGYPLSFLVRGPKGHLREARRRLRQHFAGMTDPQIDYLWEGVAWINPTLLPEVYELPHGAIAIQACNGRGLSTNTAIGIEVATMLATGRREALSITPRTPTPIRMHAAAALLPKLLMSMAYLST